MLSAQGFILGYKNVGEYDRVYSLLIQNLGRVEAVCKSVLKPRSKLAGHLEIPNFSWLEMVESVRGWQITQALEQKSFPGLRKAPAALKVVLRAARFLNDFLEEDLNQAEIFLLWEDFLNRLELYAREQKVDCEFLYSQFILRALNIFGFLSDILHCSDCNRELSLFGSLFYNGSFFCFSCAKNRSLQGQPYSKSVFSLIKQVLSGVWFRQSSLSLEIKSIAHYFQIQAYQFMI
jgi:DNA repair protein RecO